MCIVACLNFPVLSIHLSYSPLLPSANILLLGHITRVPLYPVLPSPTCREQSFSTAISCATADHSTAHIIHCTVVQVVNVQVEFLAGNHIISISTRNAPQLMTNVQSTTQSRKSRKTKLNRKKRRNDTSNHSKSDSYSDQHSF